MPHRIISRLRLLRATCIVALSACGPALSRPAVEPVAAQVITPAERAIADAVDARNAEALALLERMVNVNSGTLNFAGVRAVADVIRPELDALGFRTSWVDGAAYNRAGHLLAERDGSGPRLLLIGHLDTVFEPSSSFQRFERVSDTTARGPGVTDMKGGNVIILHALKALAAAGLLDGMSVTVVFSGDEEAAGRPLDLSRADLIEAAKRSRYAIGFEDGDGDPRTAVISRRGTSSWRLRSTGTPAHSSQIFRADVGAGAIFESARALQEFRERLSAQEFLTFNPGFALGGTDVRLETSEPGGSAFGKSNVVAKTMEVSGDLRTLSAEQFDMAKAAMRSIVARPLPGTTSGISFDDGYPPLAPTAGNRRLLSLYSAVSQALGFGVVTAVDPMRAGAADVSFAAPYVESAIDGLGLSGWDGHTDRETADLRMLAPLTKRAAIFLHHLSRGD